MISGASRGPNAAAFTKTDRGFDYSPGPYTLEVGTISTKSRVET